MKTVKKTFCMFCIMCVILSAFSVLSFAADNDITTTTEVTVSEIAETTETTETAPTETVTKSVVKYSIDFVSTIELKDGTKKIENSTIKIYKMEQDVDKDKLIDNPSKFINKECLYGTVKTDKDGKASITVVPGIYIAQEENFKVDNNEYKAEILVVTVTKRALSVPVYFKHTLVANGEKGIENIDNPYTGQRMAPAIISVAAILISTVVIIVLTKKKKENKEPENV